MPPLTDELAGKSTLICNCQIESIIQTGIDKDNGRPSDSITHFTVGDRYHMTEGPLPGFFADPPGHPGVSPMKNQSRLN